MRTIAVKFGGTSVGNMRRVRLAASSVYKEIKKGNRVAVVVSAMGHTTDALVKSAKKMIEDVDANEMDYVMALGERASARKFAAALRELGAEAVAIDPFDERWPVVTDSTHGMANIDLAETTRRFKRHIAPLLEKKITPVICGFLGMDRHGHVTTIGRGGSDITGFLVGKCLDADEVVIVTDVSGVMTADPNLIVDAQVLKKITVEEMRDLARFGAQVMHPRAMTYKDPNIDAKVLHFKNGDLSSGGTTIVGPKEAEFMGVKLYGKPLAMLTVVGEAMQTTPGILTHTTTPLSRAGINIFGVSIGPRSFSVYVAEDDTKKAIKLLHSVVVRRGHMKSVTGQGRLAMIVAESERFIDTPGSIAKLTLPLLKEKINIVEILSSRTSISFFVDWENRLEAVKLFKRVMKEMGC